MATLGHLVSDPQNFVFVRLEAQSLCFWTLIDHFRFELYKHASSAVLILVFILSLINTSILHGASPNCRVSCPLVHELSETQR